MTAPADALRGALAFLLLPLSLVPLLLRGAADPQPRWRRRPGPRAVRAPPACSPATAQLARWRAAAGRRATRSRCSPTTASTTAPTTTRSRREQFAEQMAMLRPGRLRDDHASREYVRFLQGDNERPAGAADPDHVRRRAPRLVPRRRQDPRRARVPRDDVRDRGHIEEDSSFYLTWDELRRMMKSGRWDVQEHAGVGHVNVRYDAAGHKGPSYAYRQYQRGQGPRELRAVQAPRRHDILWAKRTMTEQLPGFMPWSFAVPFGSYGQDGDTNDTRIPRLHDAPPAPALPGGVHDRAAGVHDAGEPPRGAAPDRAPRGHAHGRPLPLAARPDPGAAPRKPPVEKPAAAEPAGHDRDPARRLRRSSRCQPAG